MARRVVGLDLGAYSVKLVRLECGKQTPLFQILDQVEEVLPVYPDEERDLLALQKEAVMSFHQRGLMDAETAAIALDAASGQMFIIKTPFAEVRKIEAILPGLLDAEMPFETTEMTMSWHRCENNKQDSDSSKLESSIRIGFGKKEAIQSTLQMLQSIPFDPRFLNLASVANYELVRELGFNIFAEQTEGGLLGMAAIVDFGHRSTSVCVFDSTGLKFSRSFMRGGKKLTEDIAKALDISFLDAQKLKTENVTLLDSAPHEQHKIINEIAKNHYEELIEDILRTFITLKTKGFMPVHSVMAVGGASEATGFDELFRHALKEQGIAVISPENLLKQGISSPKMALPFALSLSCMHLHAKDNRFNFRKEEFAWRGELDFLRTKSTPLILWTLIIICSTTILWSANALVLAKENQSVEHRQKALCNQILGQPNLAAKKCLATMQEQISASSEVSIPEFSASDIYVKLATVLPTQLNVTISELDVSEKKARITAEVTNFEDVDIVESDLRKIPCLLNLEKSSAQKKDNIVKVTYSGDIDCNPPPLSPKAKSEKQLESKTKSKPKS